MGTEVTDIRALDAVLLCLVTVGEPPSLVPEHSAGTYRKRHYMRSQG